MIDHGKKNLLGVLVNAVDYQAVVARVIIAARERKPCAVAALAVHGVMTGLQDDRHRYRLNRLDVVTPDGQPVKWALNLLHKTGLRDRVYGPSLMLQLCEAASREGLGIFLYGSREEVLMQLAGNLRARFPSLSIVGFEASKFRCTDLEEKHEIASRIRHSGAALIFVGLGCPRQEIFVYEYREAIGVPLIAVGAAFDYHAGLLRQPLQAIQRAGLQWFYRLGQDPRRLWRRYLLLNPKFVMGVAAQALGLRRRIPESAIEPEGEILCA